jgi:Domain of unknown function (DUF4760)
MLDSLIYFYSTYPWAAVATAAAIGLLGTMLAISSQRAVNRRRATVDMLTTKMWDQDYIASLETFFDAMSNQEQLMIDYDLFVKYGDPQILTQQDPKLSDDLRKKVDEAKTRLYRIRYILNDRELVAIGIREGIYDEAIYRRLWYTTTLKEWKLAGPLVARIRNNSGNRAYVELEALARRWEVEGPWIPSFRTFNFLGRMFTVIRSR